jgi:hypothetical protein
MPIYLRTLLLGTVIVCAGCSTPPPSAPINTGGGLPTGDGDTVGKPDVVDTAGASTATTDSGSADVSTADTAAADSKGDASGGKDTATNTDTAGDGDVVVADTSKPIGPNCGKETDCKAAAGTTHCAILDGYCVQCVVDNHCGQGETCADYACVSIQCKPGTKKCEGLFQATCKEDGKGWDLANCPNGAPICSNGECKVCQPTQTFCAPPSAGKTDSKAVLKCNGNGTDADFVLGCSGETVCIDAKCQICTPSLKKCDGSKAVTCNPAGGNWEVFDDCGAKDLVRLLGCRPRQRAGAVWQQALRRPESAVFGDHLQYPPQSCRGHCHDEHGQIEQIPDPTEGA